MPNIILCQTLMIEKIESIRGDWEKPWFMEGALQWPRNLSGREYNGMNALMCASRMVA